jgi:hypothetical protein
MSGIEIGNAMRVAGRGTVAVAAMVVTATATASAELQRQLCGPVFAWTDRLQEKRSCSQTQRSLNPRRE